MFSVAEACRALLGEEIKTVMLPPQCFCMTVLVLEFFDFEIVDVERGVVEVGWFTLQGFIR